MAVYLEGRIDAHADHDTAHAHSPRVPRHAVSSCIYRRSLFVCTTPTTHTWADDLVVGAARAWVGVTEPENQSDTGIQKQIAHAAGSTSIDMLLMLMYSYYWKIGKVNASSCIVRNLSSQLDPHHFYAARTSN
jgi:hypothetical protein